MIKTIIQRFVRLFCTAVLVIVIASCGGEQTDKINIDDEIGEGDSGGGNGSDDDKDGGSDDNVEGFTFSMAALNDTGIEFGATDEINGNNCSYTLIGANNGEALEQDCKQGRSAEVNQDGDGVNGFDFSRINADGSEYQGSGNYNTEPWACVRDNRTGLMWEVKSRDGGIHDAENLYRWGGVTALDRDNTDRDGDYYDDWNDLIITTNKESMCGYSDWQVPNNIQLMSIAHYGLDGRPLKIDTDYFPNTTFGFYWSAMPYRGEHSEFYAWAFQFVFGNNKNLQRYQYAYLRLVRAIDSSTTQKSVEEAPDERYTLHDDGTVTDLATGLMWSQCVAGVEGGECENGQGIAMDWGEALEFAQDSTLSQYDDWRLPNSKELFSLIDFNRVDPAINLSIFPQTTNDYTWSSSPMIEFAQDSWFINFKTGLNWFKGRSDKMLVRLVRAGVDNHQLAEQDIQDREAIIVGDGLGTLPTATAPVDVHAQVLINEQAFTGDPTVERSLPDISEPISQLGKALFYSKRLSGEYDTACASCHHPALGGGDNLSWPVGYDAVDVFHDFSPNTLGPGRYFNGSDAQELASYPVIGRNAPTIFNVGLLDRGLFWDGRIESESPVLGTRGTQSGIITPDSGNLRGSDSNVPVGASLVNAQSRFPIISHNEMRGDEPILTNNQAYREMLAERFVGDREWEAMFQDAFGDQSITFDRIAQALAAFEESMVFVNNPWKEYLAALNGEANANIDVLTDDQKVGAVLFMTAGDEGGAACSSCHSGDAFTDEEFHAIGLGQVGPGNHDANRFVVDSDFGRQNMTGDIGDAYHFRTSPLLNVAVTGPYMHNGALSTLRQVMDVYGNPGGAMNDLLGIGTILNANARFNETGEADYCQLTSIADLIDKTGETCEQVYTNMNPEAFNNTRVLFRQTFDESVSNSPAPEIDINVEQSDKVIEFMHALTDPCVLNRECLQPWIIDFSNWTLHPDYNDNPAWILIGEDKQGNAL